MSGKLEMRLKGGMNENEGSTQICIHYATTINHGLFPAATNPDIANILVNIDGCIGASYLRCLLHL